MLKKFSLTKWWKIFTFLFHIFFYTGINCFHLTEYFHNMYCTSIVHTKPFYILPLYTNTFFLKLTSIYVLFCYIHHWAVLNSADTYGMKSHIQLLHLVCKWERKGRVAIKKVLNLRGYCNTGCDVACSTPTIIPCVLYFHPEYAKFSPIFIIICAMQFFGTQLTVEELASVWYW